MKSYVVLTARFKLCIGMLIGMKYPKALFHNKNYSISKEGLNNRLNIVYTYSEILIDFTSDY